jgi:hypothetical protein
MLELLRILLTLSLWRFILLALILSCCGGWLWDKISKPICAVYWWMLP